MDFEEYKRRYYANPQPAPRFPFKGIAGIALYIADYAAAIRFYTDVLGPPAYVEGENTHGWRIGDAWLTVFPAKAGAPANVDFTVMMESPAAAEALHAAFLAAGATGAPPSDQLIYEPLRYCPVTDPFGTQILIVARLEKPSTSG
jgi:catechol 2,3-dioxygenase-like lactoylglutathione lyase family enzyme